MATRRIVTLVCDLCDFESADGEVVTRTLRLEKAQGELDVCVRHDEELTAAMAPFLGAMRKLSVGKSAAPQAAGSKAGASSTSGNATAIREWARSQGLEVTDRGRISTEIREKYEAAH